MKLEVKKIIAREYIYLVIIIFIAILCFLGTFGYNLFLHYSIKNLNSRIIENSKISQELTRSSQPKLEQQSWFFLRFSNFFDLSTDSTYNTKEKLWARIDEIALKDSILYRWEKVWNVRQIEFLYSIGFSSPDSFQEFFDNNRLTPNELKEYKLSIQVNSKIEYYKEKRNRYYNNILELKDQTKIGLYSLVFLAIFLFGIRYIYYGILWSKNVLKK